MEEKKLTSEKRYEGKILTLEVDSVMLPNGNTSTREVVRHLGGVCVLALDDDGNALFVRQYRYPYGKVLLELPAGKLERGEDPGAAGRRELEEETGYVAGSYESLGCIYPSPGYVDEVLHLYLAKSLAYTAQNLDADEFLTVEKIPFDEAVGLCLDGIITDAKSVVAILKYSELLRRQRP